MDKRIVKSVSFYFIRNKTMSQPEPSSSIPLEKICGTSTRYIQLDPETCGDDDAACNRRYELYIPENLCDDVGNNDGGSSLDGDPTATSSSLSSSLSLSSSSSSSTKFGSLPLVFAVHCLGCHASAMVKFEEIATEFNFILVRPEGVEQSWNGKYCCGYALDRKLDDVRFFTRIIDDLDKSFYFVNKDMTYGVGWSNGGYMVTYAAHLFRSVAPISGYQYSDIVQINNNKPTGLFQHHSLNDRKVSYNGCCSTNSTMEKCCCGISREGGNHCTSVDQAFDIWASNVNGCSSDGATTTTYTDKKRGIQCRSGDGCKSNTTLCVYENSGHFNRGGFSFPMFEEVGDFFARDACSLNKGQWESQDKKCSCNDDDQSSTFLYCSALTISNFANAGAQLLVASGPKENNKGGWESNSAPAHTGAIFTFMVVFVFLVRKYLKWRVASGTKEKKDDWERVPSEEPNEIELQQHLY